MHVIDVWQGCPLGAGCEGDMGDTLWQVLGHMVTEQFGCHMVSGFGHGISGWLGCPPVGQFWGWLGHHLVAGFCLLVTSGWFWPHLWWATRLPPGGRFWPCYWGWVGLSPDSRLWGRLGHHLVAGFYPSYRWVDWTAPWWLVLRVLPNKCGRFNLSTSKWTYFVLRVIYIYIYIERERERECDAHDKLGNWYIILSCTMSRMWAVHNGREGPKPTGCPAVHLNFDTPLISGIGWQIRLIF